MEEDGGGGGEEELERRSREEEEKVLLWCVDEAEGRVESAGYLPRPIGHFHSRLPW